MSTCFNMSIKFCLFLGLILVCTQCQQTKDIKKVERSFYYWKTVYSLNQVEKNLLDSLLVSKLFIRYFDVDWDETTKRALPKAPITFKNIPEYNIVPVIFVTNRTMLHIPQTDIPALAKNIISGIESMHTEQWPDFEEIQIDCDWSEKSRNKYFELLLELKKNIGISKILSATIRLHQVKFSNRTGVPPVDKGVLMLYNMAALHDINTINSIFDADIITQYTDNLGDYPLGLDLAFSIYNQNVLFRAGRYISVWRDKNIFDPTFATEHFEHVKKNHFKCLKDTSIHNISVKKEDIIRVEKSDTEETKNEYIRIQKLLKRDTFTIILFDINSIHLKNKSIEEIKSIFQAK
jgi:hypothetical protein